MPLSSKPIIVKNALKSAIKWLEFTIFLINFKKAKIMATWQLPIFKEKWTKTQ